MRTSPQERRIGNTQRVFSWLNRRLWSTGSVEARQYALEKRGAILEQISLRHTRDLKQLAVLRSRVQNTSQKVDRLPDDVLLLVFSMAIAHNNVTPAFLASVCHRWMAVIYGDVGALLWSTIDLNAYSPVGAAESAERALRFVERSRSRPLTLFLRGEQVEPNDAALLRAVIRPAFGRVHKLVVENLESFASWFPLEGPCTSLHHLTLKGSARNAADEMIIFASPCPSLQRLELLPDDDGLVGDPQTRSILRNVSELTSITHLHIGASDEANGIYACLKSFPQLEYLRWRPFDSADAPQDGADELQIIPLHLPNLKTLVVASEIVRCLCELEAPLVQVLHIGEIFVGADYWGFMSPVRFPALKKITCVYPMWSTDHDIDMLFDHTHLEDATWVLYASDISDFLGDLSLRLSQQAAQSSLSKLRWLNLVCLAPYSEGYHPTDDDCDAEIVHQLRSLFIHRDALRSRSQIHFKVRLNADLVNSSTKLAALVADHPYIVSDEVAWQPPDFDGVPEAGAQISGYKSIAGRFVL